VSFYLFEVRAKVEEKKIKMAHVSHMTVNR
jgi:hypothetical protein